MLWNRSTSRRPNQPASRRCRPVVEALETRLAPANVDWINPNGGAWENAANWRDRFTGENYVPGSDDNAFIRGVVPGGCVTFRGSGPVKTLTADHCLVVAGGALTVLNPDRENSGATNLDVRNGATLRVRNGGFVTDRSQQTPTAVTLAGTLDVAGSATFILGSCGGFNGDVSDLEQGARLDGEGQYIAGGGGCGTVNVNAPMPLSMNFRVEGALVTNAETTAGANYVLQGTQRGDGVFVVPYGSVMTWGNTLGTSGLGNPCTLEIQAGGTLHIATTSLKRMDGCVVNNAGTILVTASVSVQLVNSTINNLKGGVYESQAGETLADFQGNAFNNAGLVLKTGGENVTTIGVPFHNTGLVQAVVAILRVGIGTSSGTFDAATGAVVEFDSTTPRSHTLAAGAQLTGDGLFRLRSILSVETDLSVFRLELSHPGGNPYLLVADGFTLTVTGAFDFLRGRIDGPGRIAVAEGAGMSVAGGPGSGGKTFTNIALDNFGTTTITDGHGGENQFVFANYGTVVVDLNDQATYFGTFTNYGLFFLTTAGRGRVFANAFVNDFGYVSGSGDLAGNVTNNGWIDVGGVGAAGILRIDGNFTQTANGVLGVELGGTTAGSEYDQLEITGFARLDGTLLVQLLPDYLPAAGDFFDVLRWGSRQGEFANVLPPEWNVEYGAGGLRLTA